jgi:hypothetical protein
MTSSSWKNGREAMPKLRLLLFIGLIAMLSGALGVIAMLLGAIGQTIVHTGSYSIVSVDNYQTVVMKCSSACTVTLPGARTLSSSFKTRIFSRGTATVTLVSASTIYGGKTLLPGMYTDIVIENWSAYDSTRNTNTYNWAMTSPQAGDEIKTGKAGNFATGASWFANLPVGTEIDIASAGHFHTVASSTYSLMPTGYIDFGTGNLAFCYGDLFTTATVGGTSDAPSWGFDCKLVVRSTGTSGEIFNSTSMDVWVDDSGINGYSHRQVFAYDNWGNGCKETGCTVDTTQPWTLYIRQDCGTGTVWGCSDTPPSDVWMTTLTVTIRLPWDE